MDTFSRRLRQLRDEASVKQSELAAVLHQSQSNVSAYEKWREPPYDTLVAISRYFGVTTDYLLGITEDRAPSGDALSRAIDAAAALTVGCTPLSGYEMLALFEHLRGYLSRDPSAGIAPAATLRQLILGMDALLISLQSPSPSAVLDAGNALMQSILDVSNIVSAYMQRQQK